jgi:F-type H+-transporting ATPase subunit alpha
MWAIVQAIFYRLVNRRPFCFEVLLTNNVQRAKKLSVFSTLGIVIGVTDGIVTIKGMAEVAYGEMVTVIAQEKRISCLVLNVERERIGAIALDSDVYIKPGLYVSCSGVLMSVPTGDALLGRIVDPLGKPIDSKGIIPTKTRRMVEVIAPSIIARTPVNLPLETGLKVVDSLIPIGHGQRELIIGDTKTGKTSIAIDAILNQKETDTLSIYVAVGQKRSSVARIAKILENKDCLKSTIIVAATASDPAPLQFLAPYSGVAMGEYFMEKGLRILIIYDDLTKHAVSYRQLSLLLRRPPGREAYPGDVFYVHARLLERAANLLGKGSITALPIVETIQSDLSAYIPTNVISITDGQIFLETELFSRGIRPAVSPGLSVSRVGSAAQNKVLKSMAGSLKLELAQFREVEGFTKLGFVLDEATKQLVDRGARLTKLLVQNRFSPVSMDKQILFLFSALNGYLD